MPIRRRFSSLEGQIANLQAAGSVFQGMSKGIGLGTMSGGSSGGNASPQGGGDGQQ